MTITGNDIGSIISLNHSADLIMLTDIDSEFITYKTEAGETYCKSGHELEGSLVTDPQRINLFHENVAIGAALAAAEETAMRTLLFSSKHDSEVLDAKQVLITVSEQKKALLAKIETYKESIPTCSVSSSLDELIQKAAESRKELYPTTTTSHERT